MWRQSATEKKNLVKQCRFNMWKQEFADYLVAKRIKEEMKDKEEIRRRRGGEGDEVEEVTVFNFSPDYYQQITIGKAFVIVERDYI